MAGTSDNWSLGASDKYTTEADEAKQAEKEKNQKEIAISNRAAAEAIYNKEIAEYANNYSSSIVNVVNDFDWCVNRKNVSAYQPMVYLQEYRQNLSTFRSMFNYAFNAASNAVTQSDIDKMSESDKKSVGEEGISSLMKFLIDNIATYNVPNDYNVALSQASELSPYKSLYSMEKKNCLKYVLPYFEKDVFNFNNNYGDTSQVNTTVESELSSQIDMAATLGGYIGNAMGAFGSTDWGGKNIFVEKPKYFQYTTENDTVKLSFTLYNTINHRDNSEVPWEKNYKLLQNLIFKNLPFKLSEFRYLTPCLYEVEVPGIKYFPIAYISNLTVTNRGTFHLLKPSSSIRTKRILVPEAWDINITFTSLLFKSANLFLASTNRSSAISTTESLLNIEKDLADIAATYRS